MKKRQTHIRQFELSPSAKAGVSIVKLSQDVKDHDTTVPHRDNHYLLAIATGGKATFNLDFEDLSLHAPLLLCVFPGQVHSIRESEAIQGWAVSFDPSLVDAEMQQLMEKGLQIPFFLNPHTLFFHQLTATLQLLEQLQTQATNTYTTRAMHALLMALLHLIAAEIMAVSATQKTKETRGAQIEQAFRHLLKKHYKAWKQPSQYADQLAISVSHLNDTVKAITGTTVSAHIQNQAILEAKRLLGFTQLSIKEIGYEVGYDEPVYFGKLFKKATGLTPLQFRHKFRD